MYVLVDSLPQNKKFKTKVWLLKLENLVQSGLQRHQKMDSHTQKKRMDYFFLFSILKAASTPPFPLSTATKKNFKLQKPAALEQWLSSKK